MKLIIDIGNTNTKLALFKHKELVAKLTLNNLELIKVQRFIDNKHISNAIISSVTSIDSEILKVVSHYKALVLCEDVKVPIKNYYKTPSTLGKDRLAAVIGAYSIYPKKEVLVFDSGTCLTVDFLNSKGEYIGGRISLGIEMRYQALHTLTEKLPLIKQQILSPMIGCDTNSSIVSGVQQGILSEVKSIISYYKQQYPDIIAIITGGDCFFFEKELKSSIFANPNLVLIGLNEILDFNG